MNEIRKVVSIRMKPSILEKLDCIVDHFNIDTGMWGVNHRTRELGYDAKKVSRADVIEILIKEKFNKISQ